MLATIDSFDKVFADALHQAVRSNSLAQDAARFYLDGFSTANRSRFAALDTLQQTAIKTALDLQLATNHVSRSLVDAASSLNSALFQATAAAIWPWAPLGPLTEPIIPTTYSLSPAAASEDQASAEDEMLSALRFQGPMGIIASGLGEID